MMQSQLVSDLQQLRAEAVQQLSAVDLFQPLARIQMKELDTRIKMIDYELACNGVNIQKQRDEWFFCDE